MKTYILIIILLLTSNPLSSKPLNNEQRSLFLAIYNILMDIKDQKHTRILSEIETCNLSQEELTDVFRHTQGVKQPNEVLNKPNCNIVDELKKLSNEQQPLLYTALELLYPEPEDENLLEVSKIFIKNGALVDQKKATDPQDTCLHEMVRRALECDECFPILQYIFDATKNINITDAYNRTPLMIAVISADINKDNIIISEDSDEEKEAEEDYINWCNIIELLLQKGACAVIPCLDPVMIGVTVLDFTDPNQSSRIWKLFDASITEKYAKALRALVDKYPDCKKS